MSIHTGTHLYNCHSIVGAHLAMCPALSKPVLQASAVSGADTVPLSITVGATIRKATGNNAGAAKSWYDVMFCPCISNLQYNNDSRTMLWISKTCAFSGRQSMLPLPSSAGRPQTPHPRSKVH